jgi:membrane-associated phospholipid phosphatase
VLLELLQSVDKGTYYSFSDAAQKHSLLATIAQIGHLLGSYIGIGLFALLTLILLLVQGRRRAAVATVFALAVGVAGVETLRSRVPAARPDAVAGSVSADEMQRSFPSSEVFSFTMVATLFLISAWGALLSARGALAAGTIRWVLAGLVTVLILWVAMSELLLDLHFVTDVAAGLFGGLALALLAHRFFEPVTA